MKKHESIRSRTTLLLSALALISASPALAQSTVPVNEPQIIVKSEDDTNIWSGGAEVNANITSGNVDIETIGGAGELMLKTLPFTNKLKLGYLRNRTDDQERARTLYGNLRTGVNVANNLDFFAQGNYFQNRFSGVINQWEGDTGLGLYLINSDTLSLHVEGGVGYLTEEFVQTGENSFLLARPGAGVTVKLSEVADLNIDASYIHSFRNSDDWRVMGTAGISSKISSILNLKISHNFMRRNLSVPGFERTDQATLAALVLKY